MASNYSRGDRPVPDYELVELLGQGGFGVVWKAAGPGGVQVALKIINLTAKQAHKEFRGLQRVKQLRHPNLVPIYGFWIKDASGNLLHDTLAADDLPSLESSTPVVQGTMVVSAPRASRPAELIIAMGLGDRTLTDRLHECRREGQEGIDADELIGYMEDAARALDYLNNNSVQHCDIKPSNIMIVGGAAQVCDFGLARLLGDVRATSAAVSPAYSAPEFIRDNQPSETTDQYSLAITYHELRTGVLPFAEGSPLAVMRVHTEGRLDHTHLPRAEREVMQKATALDPSQRYENTVSMVRALRRACEGTLTAPAPAAESRVKEAGEIVPGYRLRKKLVSTGVDDVWEAQGPAGVVALVIRDLAASQTMPDFEALELIRGLEHEYLTELRNFWLLDAQGNVVPDHERPTGTPPPGTRLVSLGRLARTTLKQRIEDRKASAGRGFDAPEAIRLLGQIAEAVDFLNADQHELSGRTVSIQHRAIRPDNVMCHGKSVQVGNYLSACVLEGPATAVTDAPPESSIPYAAPETLARVVTHWSDQFSLAITYFELRTGRLPFDPASSSERIAQILRSGQLDLSLLDEAEQEVIARATSAEPGARFESCVAMVEALEEAAGTVAKPVEEAPPKTLAPRAEPAPEVAPPVEPPKQDVERSTKSTVVPHPPGGETIAPPPVAVAEKLSAPTPTSRDTQGTQPEVTETDTEVPASLPGATTSTPLPPQQADQLVIGDRYQLIDMLGEGAYAVVYRARDTRLDQDVAIKMLRLEHTTDAARLMQLRTMFSREARMLASLQHEHIVRVLDTHLTSTGIPYIVTDFLEGQLLRQVLNSEGALETERADRILKQLCSALDTAHEEKVIHRDLKPNNLMLVKRRGEESVLVLDFGLAKLVDHAHMSLTQGTPMGTPAYMAPELHHGADATPRSDIYAIGVILFEMLTGRLPFTAVDVQEMVRQHCQEPPPNVCEINASVPPEVDGVLRQALAKDLEKRFGSAMELYDAFHVASGLAQIETPIVGTSLLERKRKSQLVSLSILVSSVVLIGLGIWLAFGGGGKPEAFSQIRQEVRELVQQSQFAAALAKVRPQDVPLSDRERESLIKEVADAWQTYAEAILNEQRYEDALVAASDILEQFPGNQRAAAIRDEARAGIKPPPSEVLAEAQQFLESGDLSKSLARFDLAIDMLDDPGDPQRVDALLGRAKASARLAPPQWDQVQKDLQAISESSAVKDITESEQAQIRALQVLHRRESVGDEERTAIKILEDLALLKGPKGLGESLDAPERNRIVDLAMQTVGEAVQKATIAPLEEAPLLINAVLAFDPEHTEASAVKAELDAIQWAGTPSSVPPDVKLDDAFAALLSNAPRRRLDLCVAYAKLALQAPETHLDRAIATLSTANEKEVASLRQQLYSKKAELTLGRLSNPTVFSAMLPICEQANALPAPGGWVRISLAECLIETIGADTQRAAVLQRAQAAAFGQAGEVDPAYVFYVRALVHAENRDTAKGAAELARALESVEIPKAMDNPYRRGRAATILAHGAHELRTTASFLSHQFYESPEAAQNAYRWLEAAERLSEQAGLSEAQARADFVLAAWQKPQRATALARRLSKPFVQIDALQSVPRDATSILFVAAQSHAEEPADFQTALPAYAQLVKATAQQAEVLIKPLEYYETVVSPAIATGERALDAGSQLDKLVASLYGVKGRLIRDNLFVEWPFDQSQGETDDDRALNEAKSAYARASELEPSDPRYIVGQGLIAAQQGADPKSILREADRAIMLDNSYGGGHGLRGFALHQLSQTLTDPAARLETERDALASYDLALAAPERKDEFDEGSDRGTYLMNRSVSRLLVANFTSDIPEAEEYVNGAIEDALAAIDSPMPYKQWAWVALGNAREDRGWLLKDYGAIAEAIEAFSKAIDTRDSPQARLNRGRCYAKWLVDGGATQEGILDAATSDLRNAKQQQSTQAEASYWLGYLAYKRNLPQQAETEFGDAVAAAREQGLPDLGYYLVWQAKAQVQVGWSLASDDEKLKQKTAQARNSASEAIERDRLRQFAAGQWAIGQSWELEGQLASAEEAYAAGLTAEAGREDKVALHTSLAVAILKSVRSSGAGANVLRRLESAAQHGHQAAEASAGYARALALGSAAIAYHTAATQPGADASRYYRLAADDYAGGLQAAPESPDAIILHQRRATCLEYLANQESAPEKRRALLQEAISELKSALEKAKDNTTRGTISNRLRDLQTRTR